MELYTKTIDGRAVIKPRNKIVVVKDDMQTINPSHDLLIEDGWELYIEPTPTEEEQREAERVSAIAEMKENLASTDYKVIKCLEAMLCGEEMPYDIKALHEEREGYRRVINENE